MTGLALLAGLCPEAAEAHSVLGTTRWWDGALHLVLSPLSIAAILGLAAALSPRSREAAVGLFLVAAAGAFAGATVLPLAAAALLAPAGPVLAGLAAALRLVPGLIWSAVGAAFIGLTAGAAASPDAPLDLEMAVGCALGTLVLGANASVALAWLGQKEETIPRILGAWCGAIGLMVGLLPFATP